VRYARELTQFMWQLVTEDSNGGREPEGQTGGK